MDASQLFDSLSRLAIDLIAVLGFCLAYKVEKEVNELKDEIGRIKGKKYRVANRNDRSGDGDARR